MKYKVGQYLIDNRDGEIVRVLVIAEYVSVKVMHAGNGGVNDRLISRGVGEIYNLTPNTPVWSYFHSCPKLKRILLVGDNK